MTKQITKTIPGGRISREPGVPKLILMKALGNKNLSELTEYYKSVENLTYIFLEKYFSNKNKNVLDWQAGIVGSSILYKDYSFDFLFIQFCIERNIKASKLFDYLYIYQQKIQYNQNVDKSNIGYLLSDLKV
jgi:hypothetical protein